MSGRTRSGGAPSSRPPAARGPAAADARPALRARGSSTRPPPSTRAAPSRPRLPAISGEDEVRARLERLAALGARSAELAHELRNALAVLETSLHIVRRTAKTALESTKEGEKLEAHFQRMAEQIHVGQSLVREALDDVRAARPERTDTDLRGLVLEVVAGVARPEGVGLEVDVARARVSVDPQLMRQLLLNLLRNAVEAIGSSTGTVRVVGKVDEALTLSVEDDGPGIDAAIAPRLFQAFATSKANGTGLGLAVCRRIAEAHGGRIEARRRDPHGTAIDVTIPL